MHKANAVLNRERGKHVSRFVKKQTNKIRRAEGRSACAANE